MFAMKRRSMVLGFAMLLVMVVIDARASSFVYEGKEISKGEAIKILIANPKAKVLKVDEVVFNDEKGTLKTKSK